MKNDQYMSTEEVQRFLGISKSTFYERYYHELIADETTLLRHRRPRYFRPRVLELLTPAAKEKAYLDDLRERARNHFRPVRPRTDKKPGKGTAPGQLPLLWDDAR